MCPSPFPLDFMQFKTEKLVPADLLAGAEKREAVLILKGLFSRYREFAPTALDILIEKTIFGDFAKKKDVQSEIFADPLIPEIFIFLRKPDRRPTVIRNKQPLDDWTAPISWRLIPNAINSVLICFVPPLLRRMDSQWRCGAMER